MPRDDVLRAAAMPSPPDQTILLLQRQAARPRILRLSLYCPDLPLFPCKDVRERVLEGPSLSVDPRAFAESRYPPIEALARERANGGVEPKVLRTE